MQPARASLLDHAGLMNLFCRSMAPRRQVRHRVKKKRMDRPENCSAGRTKCYRWLKLTGETGFEFPFRNSSDVDDSADSGGTAP
jgi:hypothetical protein